MAATGRSPPLRVAHDPHRRSFTRPCGGVLVKFPTADEDKGLGTGEFDYIGQLDLAKTFGRFTPLATVGYKVKTDAPGLELDNVWFASGGTAYQFDDIWSGGLTLDYQEASTDSAEDALELFG
jgi:hypothetical protein